MDGSNEQLDQALISIIIPFYNTHATLGRCMESALSQTIAQIEIICVDDGSTDGSADIICQFSKADKRVILLQSAENGGCLRARKRGVEAATGEYIMFLDSDDTLEPNACEVLLRLAREQGTDITQGTSSIEMDNRVNDPAAFQQLTILLRPCYELLRGRDIFRAFFVDQRFGQTLFCRLFRTGMCKQGFERLPDEYNIYGEDVMATVSMALLARSYVGVNTEVLYHYNYGNGVSTSRKRLSLQQFQMRAESLFVGNRSIRFLLESEGITRDAKVRKALAVFEQNNINVIFYWWERALSSSDRSAAFSTIAASLAPIPLVERLQKDFTGNEQVLAEALYRSESLSVHAKQITTLGVHYSRYTVGGLERVLSELFPMWISMGYQIVFFCESAPQPDEYPLPHEVIRLQVPLDETRLAFIASAIDEYHIDVYIDNDWTRPQLLWDMLTVKLSGVPFITYVHNTIIYDPYMPNYRFNVIQRTLRLSELLLILNEYDGAFWEQSGAQVFCISNPYRPLMEHTEVKQQDDTVVWVGRIAFEKKYSKAVEIMGLVKREIPDAKLLIVGTGEPSELEKLKNAIKNVQLEDSVMLCGYQSDVEPYYRRARIYLHTASLEGWPMSIYEAMTCGKPIVMFELPYLTLLQDNDGVISVPQDDCPAAADEIIRLLREPAYRESREAASLAAVARFAARDIREEWICVFRHCRGEDVPLYHASDDVRRRILERMAQFYNSCGGAPISSSLSRHPAGGNRSKLGRALTLIPRAIYWTWFFYHKRGGLKAVRGLYKRKFKKYFLGIPDEMEGV